MYTSPFRLAALALLPLLALPAASRAQKPSLEASPAETRPFTAPCLLIPQSRAYQTGTAAPAIRVRKVTAHADVEGQRATVRLEVVVENATTADSSAQLLVPLPRRTKLAEVSVGDPDAAGEKLAASVRRGKNATSLWTAASRHVASLEPLEFSSHDAVRTASFPVAQGKTKRVVLALESELPLLSGRVDLLLPRTAAPSDVEWDVSVNVRAPQPIATVFSPTHELSTESRSGREVEVTVTNAKTAPGPISISVLLGGATWNEPVATFFTFPDPESGGGYFLMLGVMPKASGDRAPQPREVLFVLDRSGSMSGEKIEQARRAILKSLNRLRDGEVFNIIDYASEIQTFASQSVVKNPQTLVLAEQYIHRMGAGGGTNLNEGLVTALRIEPPPNVRPTVLFVTDGMASEGETREFQIRANAIAANVHGRAIHTVGIGEQVNAPLLSGLAEVSGGSCRFVKPGEDVEAILVEAFEQTGQAALEKARLEAAPGARIDDLQPARLGDLRDGERFVVLGRYHGTGPVPVRLVGASGEETAAYDFTIDPAADGRPEPSVARMWAYRKIATIARTVAETPVDGGAPPNVSAAAAEITRLAVDYGVVTEYTGFLADPKADISDRESLVAAVFDDLRTATRQSRSGASAISRVQRQRQSQNGVQSRDASAPAVCFVRDAALVRRDNRWVDLRVLVRGEAKPASIVKPGSAELDALRETLVTKRYGSAFAFSGAIFDVDGRVVQIGQRP